jgi:hypothetical protein
MLGLLLRSAHRHRRYLGVTSQKLHPICHDMGQTLAPAARFCRLGLALKIFSAVGFLTFTLLWKRKKVGTCPTPSQNSSQ